MIKKSVIELLIYLKGYVQGMNFIVGFFLYHCEDHVAFWLFVSLIEEYELREIYLEGIIYLKKSKDYLD